MNRHRIAALAALFAAGVALAGCWTSDKLLLDRKARVKPVAEGHYAASDGSKIGVSLDAKGWYVLANEGDDATHSAQDQIPMMLTPMTGLAKDTYVFAAGASDCIGGTDKCKSWTYGLARVRGAEIDEALPDCEKTQPIVRAHHGKVSPPNEVSETTCEFRTAAGVKAALLAWSKKPDIWVRTYKKQ
jgi:hypothetical protein